MKQQLYDWIGKKIAAYRQAQKISQTDLAKLTNLSRGSIANIEKGRQQTSLHVLWDIAYKLEVSIESILPLQNEHLTKSTDDLLDYVDEIHDLDQENKGILSKFLKDNL